MANNEDDWNKNKSSSSDSDDEEKKEYIASQTGDYSLDIFQKKNITLKRDGGSMVNTDFTSENCNHEHCRNRPVYASKSARFHEMYDYQCHPCCRDSLLPFGTLRLCKTGNKLHKLSKLHLDPNTKWKKLCCFLLFCMLVLEIISIFGIGKPCLVTDEIQTITPSSKPAECNDNDPCTEDRLIENNECIYIKCEQQPRDSLSEKQHRYCKPKIGCDIKTCDDYIACTDDGILPNGDCYHQANHQSCKNPNTELFDTRCHNTLGCVASTIVGWEITNFMQSRTKPTLEVINNYFMGVEFPKQIILSDRPETLEITRVELSYFNTTGITDFSNNKYLAAICVSPTTAAQRQVTQTCPFPNLSNSTKTGLIALLDSNNEKQPRNQFNGPEWFLLYYLHEKKMFDKWPYYKEVTREISNFVSSSIDDAIAK